MLHKNSRIWGRAKRFLGKNCTRRIDLREEKEYNHMVSLSGGDENEKRKTDSP